ncbi:Leukotriene B4 receptor 1 [Collichthys lucidus]|uniref:Leukotriene B4 receptor 1 n=1 Tax=Collichthys lucidus TaxID=240159 RepID=A0A4V6AQ87_COLLU|nr:Leukotriene B4 receptor 1 [Collichthys lucidus]
MSMTHGKQLTVSKPAIVGRLYGHQGRDALDPGLISRCCSLVGGEERVLPAGPMIMDESLFNNTNPEDESVVSNDFSTTLGALILGFVFLLGVPGNLFIVWSILARIRRRSVTTLLILNLACADGFLMALTIFFVRLPCQADVGLW